MGDEGQASSPTSQGATQVCREHAARDCGNGTIVSSNAKFKSTRGPETSRFAMTALIDPRRVGRLVYEILLHQQSTLDRIQSSQISTNNILKMTVINQSSPQPSPVHLSETRPMSKQSTQVISNPTKLLPRTVRFDRGGISAQIVVLPRGKGKSYQAAVQISLFGKMYTIQLQISFPDFSFDRMFHVRNIVPTDSAMTVACRTGDFNSARTLLSSGAAHGSDITLAGRPMLDVSVILSIPKIAMLMIRAVCYRERVCQARPLAPRPRSSSRHGVWGA